MIANCITVSRILFSLAMLALPPRSVPFAAFYLLCGATDVLDGFAARKLRTESEKGAMLDSAADLFFSVVYALKILPLLCLPAWLWIWIVFIAVVKVLGIFRRSKRERRLCIPHSFENKLCGLLLFLLPLTACLAEFIYCAVLVCFAASFAAAKELLMQG